MNVKGKRTLATFQTEGPARRKKTGETPCDVTACCASAKRTLQQCHEHVRNVKVYRNLGWVF